MLLRFIISNVFSFYTSTYFLWHAVTIVITSWPALRFFVFVRHTTHCFLLLVCYMFFGWKHCPEEAHMSRWAKRWLIIKYNHQKSLFICLFDLKSGGKRYETTLVAKRTEITLFARLSISLSDHNSTYFLLQGQRLGVKMFEKNAVLQMWLNFCNLGSIYNRPISTWKQPCVTPRQRSVATSCPGMLAIRHFQMLHKKFYFV